MLAALLPALLVDRVGWLLVHSIWQFTLVALVLVLVLRAMQRVPATARYGAGVLAWAVMLIAPAVTWLLLPASAPDAETASFHAPSGIDGAQPAGPAFPAGSQGESAPLGPAADPLRISSVPGAPAVVARSTASWWNSLETRIAAWLDELVALWCLGVLLFGLRPAWGWHIVNRLRRCGVSAAPSDVTAILARASRQLGVRQKVHVWQSTLVTVPAVVGGLRPVILLPLRVVSGLSATQVEAILAHELAHIRRHDYLINLLQTLSETVFFYHPALWWVSSRIRQEREHCCDELAAGVLGSRAEYGRALLALEELRGTVPVLSLGARGGSLLERIRRLAEVEPSPRLGAGGFVTVALMVLMLIGLGLWSATQAQLSARESRALSDSTNSVDTEQPAAPEETASPNAESPDRKDADQRPGHRVSVRVDSEGQPVAGAEVHLFQYSGTDRRYVHSGPFTSDEQGRATAPEPLFTDASGHFDRWIYARVPGRLVGVSRSAKWKNRQVVNPEFQVELQPSRSVEGQVTVPRGFDLANVTVRVRVLHVVTGPGDFDYGSFPREDAFPGLDTALPEIFDRRPDAAGRVRFGDVPVRGRLYLVTSGEGLAEAQWMNRDSKSDEPDFKFDEPIALDIEEEGRLSGRVLAPDGKPAAGVEIAARLSPRGGRRAYYLSTFRAITDESGDFVISGLPHIEFVLSVELVDQRIENQNDPRDRWTFRPREDLLVAPGEALNLALQLEAGILVTGRVLDPAGQPVAGAGFSAVTDSRRPAGLDDDSTDADGRYEFRLPSGGARLYFNSLPDGFVYPQPQVIKELDIQPGQAAIENLDFTIPRKPDGGG